MEQTEGINKNLLLAAMLAGGGAMTQGESPWPAISGVAQNQMASQNYWKVLQELLKGGQGAGKLPAGASLTMDRDKTVMKVPTSALGEGGFEGTGMGNPGSYTPAPSGRAVTAPTSAMGKTDVTPSPQQRSMSAYLNPSSSPLGNITAADLVGLTPKDLSQALGIKLTKDQLDLAKQTAAEETEIKRTNASTAQAKALMEYQKMLRTAPLTVPGLGELSFDEWNSLDTKTKAYSYYANDANNRGEEVMDFNSWDKQVDDPLVKQIYELALEDEDFMDFYFQSRKAGATNISIGEKVETAEALAGVKSKTYFTSPTGLVEDVDKYINSEDVQNELFQYAGDPQKMKGERIRAREGFIETKIKSSGGKVVKKYLDGREFVWEVKWPDGSTSEVRYAN